MNEPLYFDRVVAGHIRGEGVKAPSDAFYDELITRARRSVSVPSGSRSSRSHPCAPTRTHRTSPAWPRSGRHSAHRRLHRCRTAGSRLIAADGTSRRPVGQRDFTTIVEAVAAAQDGDTVLIKPGRYAERASSAGPDLGRREPRRHRHRSRPPLPLTTRTGAVCGRTGWAIRWQCCGPGSPT
jgi:hypothetical protein